MVRSVQGLIGHLNANSKLDNSPKLSLDAENVELSVSCERFAANGEWIRNVLSKLTDYERQVLLQNITVFYTFKKDFSSTN